MNTHPFEKPSSKPLSFQQHVQRLAYQIRHPFKFRRVVKRSAKHKCIFVHIPKCAGASIRESLFGGPGAHRTLAGYQTVLAPQLFADCFKFTFVRNPWDRVVSAFFYLKNKNMKSNQQWAKKNLSPFQDFNAFVREWLTPENIWSYVFFRPQYHFICLNGKQPAVDFIGFFENLAPDFALIRERIKSPAKLAEKNRNPLRGQDYREYYSDETRGLVAEIYAEDIELFGYSFDNSSLPAQIAARDEQLSAVMA
ncbi:MAG TPA: sulfotransferase family 2 domain-containing protein [Candidatus Angelobacter sp.]|nr:sulfotransferase family 2 domain-containing protein [Candidatus Angelobacter sp.]